MPIEFKTFEKINYIVRLPEGFDDGKKYPVLIFLHGSGTRGNNATSLLGNHLFTTIQHSYSDFPFVLVAPQCHANTWFDIFEMLKRFTVKIAEEEYTDRERIYLMGASMGAYGSWQLAMSMPELFAAIVPICGGGMYWNALRLVNVPIWAFHGAKDGVVLCEESKKMVDAVNQRGGNARLTVYPENQHDAWSDTYKNREVFEWLLSCKNNNSKPIEEIFNDSNIYG